MTNKINEQIMYEYYLERAIAERPEPSPEVLQALGRAVYDLSVLQGEG